MAIAWVEELSQPQLQKLQAQRAKTPAKRHKQRQAELSFRYEVVHLHKKSLRANLCANTDIGTNIKCKLTPHF